MTNPSKDEVVPVPHLRSLVLPQATGDIKRYKHGWICSLTDAQIDKLNTLFLNKYGSEINGYSPAHHYFLQEIIHYSRMDFNLWEEKLSDECIADVHAIAPALFDPSVIKAFYKLCGVLDGSDE